MFLLILESIGTQELILIGIIALVVFGPRKLPEMARKMGSMMAEFRKVSGDFRSTWENAVKIDEEENYKKINSTSDSENSINDENEKEKISQRLQENTNGKTFLPEVREISGEDFESLMKDKKPNPETEKAEKTEWF